MSEDRLRLVISEFKNEIIEELRQYASSKTVEALEQRVKALELWQAAVGGSDKARRMVSAAAATWAVVVIGAIAAIGTYLSLRH